MTQKTIFFTSFHGYISRNILSTETFARLRAVPAVRVVVFALDYKRPYFEKNFAGENVIIEGVPFDPPSKRLATLVCKRIAKFALDSYSVRNQRRMKWKREGKLFYFLATSLVATVLAHSRLLRALMRQLDYMVAQRDRYRPYFERYQPSLVVATDIQNERDVEVLQNARFFGVRSLAMVRSWDNLTTHGFIRALPDRLLATCATVREQAITFNDMPPGAIEVVGITHYDKYRRGPMCTKEEFFRSMGLDPGKKTILYATVGDHYLMENDADPYVFELLGREPYQVIVRFSPSVPVATLKDARPYPNMVFDRPGVNFREGDMGDQEMSREDDDRLMRELYFSDVVVCGPSTICLDAMSLDKPVVLIDCYRNPKKEHEKVQLYHY
ncbi:MAG: hypothetical protein U1A16_03345, partial [Patescibacteria group bacterium]|nr:hypothetical protein [Patescibacteria group bacterium]